ncbi:hypothetical protein Taro_014638 [Colocasia esculenta]|uniref:Uncharacterized protein n=1 Tax=Colocasia esculenta TaxID=4460 RepID=A0A843UMD1_COLES|nr:hypothetical protein [Colocasia esculenta]
MELLPLPASPLLLLTAAVVAAAALLFSAARLTKSRRPRRYHPVVGTVLHQIRYFHKFYHYHTELSRHHKSFRISTAPFHSDVYTSDPSVVEYMLRTNFHNYGKGMLNSEVMKDLLGDGIFAVDGSKWRHQRKLASYEFTTRSLREHSGAVFKNNAAKLAAAMSEAASSHEAVEMQDWFTRSSMDSVFEVAFGTKLYCLEDSSEENRRFLRAIDDATAQISMRYINPFWRLMRFFNIGMEAALRENIKVVDDLVYKVIHSKVAKMSNQGSESADAEREDIMSRFLRESERDPKTLNHKYLRDISLSFVVAGKDSTGGTMSWFMYMLCKHPSEQEKVAKEIRQTVRAPENATFQDFSERITDEALGKLQYLHAALTETMRLYPAIAMDPKVCFSDDTLPDGFAINKGETIMFQSYCMGRMAYLWGEDAEVFRPQRWLDENGMFCAESPFKFTAFQAGPRTCLGKEFAYRQMKIYWAVLLRFFRFRLRDDDEPVNCKMSLSLLIEPGIFVHVSNRS